MRQVDCQAPFDNMNARLCIVGHRDMVGAAIVRRLRREVLRICWRAATMCST